MTMTHTMMHLRVYDFFLVQLRHKCLQCINKIQFFFGLPFGVFYDLFVIVSISPFRFLACIDVFPIYSSRALCIVYACFSGPLSLSPSSLASISHLFCRSLSFFLLSSLFSLCSLFTSHVFSLISNLLFVYLSLTLSHSHLPLFPFLIDPPSPRLLSLS